MAMRNLDIAAVDRTSNEDLLMELDLSNVQDLTTLSCEDNPLTELDIRPLRKLESLYYDSETTHLIKRADQEF